MKTLSEKRDYITYENCRMMIGQRVYEHNDVKEFIKELKDWLKVKGYHNEEHSPIHVPDLLRWLHNNAGSELIGEKEVKDGNNWKTKGVTYKE